MIPEYIGLPFKIKTLPIVLAPKEGGPRVVAKQNEPHFLRSQALDIFEKSRIVLYDPAIILREEFRQGDEISAFPFDNVYIEKSNSPLMSIRGGEKVWAIWASDVSDKDKEWTFALAEQDDVKYILSLEPTDIIKSHRLVFGSLLEPLGNKNKYICGNVNTRETVKINKNNIKRIKDIVYISNRTHKTDSYQNKKIDWSHRWEVRGHWRRVDFMGKDRSGAYNVFGKTWVDPHEKGAGELVIKKRFVKGEINEQRITG